MYLLIFCTRSYRYEQRLRIAVLLLSVQVTPLFSVAICSDFTATNIDITAFYIRINFKLFKAVNSVHQIVAAKVVQLIDQITYLSMHFIASPPVFNKS